MFSDTDSKNEKIDIIKLLVMIGNWLINYKQFNYMDDYGRHTEMALKIDPKNSDFLLGNEKQF